MNNAHAEVAQATSVPSLDFLKSLIQSEMKQVDAVITHAVTQDIPLIHDIAHHIIVAGGKRLRPALTLASAQLCHYTGHRHIHLAAAVELIHTATLLHDDVVDESTLRRGDHTANAIWSNQASVLVGDFLLSRAFQLMVADGSLKVLKVLSDASATISQGEVMQMATANDPATTEAQYIQVITAKTATLFEAACQIGAILSDTPEQEQHLADFGRYLGIAFQLVDDALDYSANQQALGKTVGDDFREGKITLPVILAYSASNTEEKAFWHRTLEKHEQTEKDIHTAIDYINRHGTIVTTTQKASEYVEKARQSLAVFPESKIKQALEETLDFCVQRAY